MSATIGINLDACIGCRTCVDACFVDVLRWDETEAQPVIAYEQDCVWCFTCEINCPVQCINIQPHMQGPRVSPY